MLTLALPKGRMADESMELLQKAGLIRELPDPDSRELTYTDSLKNIKIFLVKPQDVPTYVEECAADAGIAGWDTLKEGSYDLIVPLTLEIGRCRLSLAGHKDFNLDRDFYKLKVATKYPNLTKQFFFSKGISCEIIKLYGSIELAPLCGLSDCIVDLVSSGETLRANGLSEIEVILPSTARLFFNRSALYRNRLECLELIQKLQSVCAA
ncbi:MAG: ATP phosphoribosyltransferase [Leptospiraceae bacterium]|nr:ATP phosphoribosyltransferase [Leptospiraceae bacterium]MCP5499366.1 ATP phosphoribosyltransferase [Leptospiraceae bacterium]